MLDVHHSRLSKHVSDYSLHQGVCKHILTLQNSPLRCQTLRLALQSPPIPEVHHDAVGHLLAFEIRCKGSSEFTEMIFLNYAAV
jgi:hypothetical protein